MPSDSGAGSSLVHDVPSFLRFMRPEGWMTLVSIHPAGGPTSGRAFAMPSGGDAAQIWSQEQQHAGRNVYFTVNPTKDALHKKPKREDILECNWVHVDIDPDIEKHGSYDAARSALLGAPLLDLQCFVPPDIIVDSGNGVAAYWRVDDEFGLYGEDDVAELNKRAIARFGGDEGTHNVDRIMRLPYTYNFPDARKIKKGYPHQPTIAGVISCDGDPGAGRRVSALLQALPPVPEGFGRGTRLGTGEKHSGAMPAVRRPEDWKDERELALQALRFLDPDMDMRSWVEVGMALQEAGGGWEDWDDWSQEGSKYVGSGDTQARWRGFEIRPGGVTRALLFGLATAAGWTGNKRARVTVEEMFGRAPVSGTGAAPVELDVETDLWGDPIVPVPGVGGDGAQGVGVEVDPVAAEWGLGPVGPAPLTPEVRAAMAAAAQAREVEAAGEAQRKGVLVELKNAVNTLTAGSENAEITVVLRKLADAQLDELDTADLIQRIKDSTTRTLKSLNSAFKTQSEAARKERRNAFSDRTDYTLEGRLSRAVSTLSHGAVSDPRDFPALAARYVYVQGHGKFYDRLTCKLVAREHLDMMTAHLGWGVVKHADIVGGTPSSGDEGAPPSTSIALTQSTGSVKVEAMDYWPGIPTAVFADNEVLALNSWRDDGLKPVQGDVSLWLRHLEWLIPEVSQRTYLLKWMAFCLRHQDKKINHNVLMYGITRIGKDALFVPLFRGLGASNVSIINPEVLTEPYEDFLVGTKLLVLNELKFQGMSRASMENKLKPYGAAPPYTLNIRRFGEPSVVQRNVVQMVAFTNHKAAMSISTSAERWFCVDVQRTEDEKDEKNKTTYYADLYSWLLDGGGCSAVLHYLHEQVDLSDFKPSAIAPTTEWRESLLSMSKETDELTVRIRDLIDEKASPFVCDLVTIGQVVGMMQATMFGNNNINVTTNSVSRALVECGCVCSPKEMSYREKADKTVVKKVKLWAVRNTQRWSAEKRNFVWTDHWQEGKEIPGPPTRGNADPIPLNQGK